MKILKTLGIILLIGLLFFFFGAAKITDRQLNTTFFKDTPIVSKAAQELHAQYRSIITRWIFGTRDSKNYG